MYIRNLPFFKSIFIFLPPFLPVRLDMLAAAGLLLASGLSLRGQVVGDELAALAVDVGDALSKEPYTD